MSGVQVISKQTVVSVSIIAKIRNGEDIIFMSGAAEARPSEDVSAVLSQKIGEMLAELKEMHEKYEIVSHSHSIVVIP